MATDETPSKAASANSPGDGSAASSAWYPLLALLLAGILVTQIIFLRKNVSSGENRSGQNQTFNPNSGPSGRPMPGGTMRPGGGPSGQPGGPGGQPGGPGGPGGSGGPGGPSPEIPQPPQETERPFLGPTPTADTATWFWVPGNYILYALMKVDKATSTTFTTEQIKQILALLGEIAPAAQAARSAETQLVDTATGVLSKEQMVDLTEHKDAIEKISIEPDALIALLKTAAGSTAAAVPSPTSSGSPDALQTQMAPNYLMFGLVYLQKSEKNKLQPAQAAALLPLVTSTVEKNRAQVAFYPKALALFTPPQREAFIQQLIDMRTGKLPMTAKINLEDVVTYLKSRAQ